MCKDKKRVFLGGSNVVSNAGACHSRRLSLLIPSPHARPSLTPTASLNTSADTKREWICYGASSGVLGRCDSRAHLA